MKRKIALALFTISCMAFVFAGCKKKEAEVVPEQLPTKEEVKEAVKEIKKEESFEFKPGVYSMQYEEEFADGMETFTNYLYFGEGGKGFYIVQDDIAITYTKDSFTTENGNTYSFTMTSDKTLEVDEDGNKVEYTYSGKELPEDVLDTMRHFIDGTLKINNPEAGFAFYDLITSDTITFYSYKSTVAYEAEGADLEDMRAAYIEMTDKHLPVLFVKTPDAPKEVGVEHVLQYVDGKIFDIIGVDKIDAVYVENAVIVASFDDENGTTTYYYKPDENDELVAYISKTVKDGTVSGMIFDGKDWTVDVSEEELNKAIEDTIAGAEPLDEIKWKTLNKAI